MSQEVMAALMRGAQAAMRAEGAQMLLLDAAGVLAWRTSPLMAAMCDHAQSRQEEVRGQ